MKAIAYSTFAQNTRQNPEEILSDHKKLTNVYYELSRQNNPESLKRIALSSGLTFSINPLKIEPEVKEKLHRLSQAILKMPSCLWGDKFIVIPIPGGQQLKIDVDGVSEAVPLKDASDFSEMELSFPPELDFGKLILREKKGRMVVKKSWEIKRKNILDEIKINPQHEKPDWYSLTLELIFSDSKNLKVGPGYFLNIEKNSVSVSDSWFHSGWKKTYNLLLEHAKNYLNENREILWKLLSDEE